MNLYLSIVSTTTNPFHVYTTLSPNDFFHSFYFCFLVHNFQNPNFIITTHSDVMYHRMPSNVTRNAWFPVIHGSQSDCFKHLRRARISHIFLTTLQFFIFHERMSFNGSFFVSAFLTIFSVNVAEASYGLYYLLSPTKLSKGIDTLSIIFWWTANRSELLFHTTYHHLISFLQTALAQRPSIFKVWKNVSSSYNPHKTLAQKWELVGPAVQAYETFYIPHL